MSVTVYSSDIGAACKAGGEPKLPVGILVRHILPLICNVSLPMSPLARLYRRCELVEKGAGVGTHACCVKALVGNAEVRYEQLLARGKRRCKLGQGQQYEKDNRHR